ncbi:hypothetical protein VSDG_00859 [Cytospora chrysosperma]|uniref:Methyltransferase type 11 domain-containing protein n=1 Tax=Cytospora chrysosperma TaxID=252740 RepID=A0A423WLI0_CYTCH|nr:hypothetical protein VSDG_00859 [Valsa sordida]
MVLTSPPAPQPSRPGEDGDGAAVDAYEEAHVHGVYEAIAPHFSATRHKPWPLVSSFLASRAPGSVGLDVGCGNGKNMGVNRDVVMLGCDRSAALASADFAICIAVIHHLSTRERRVDAIRQLLRCIRRGHQGGGGGDDDDNDGGKVLVYVWALEQRSSRRGWDEGGEQDLLVPWGDRHADKTFHRYYHLYRKGELEDEVISAGGKVIKSGYERDNWWVIAG